MQSKEEKEKLKRLYSILKEKRFVCLSPGRRSVEEGDFFEGVIGDYFVEFVRKMEDKFDTVTLQYYLNGKKAELRYISLSSCSEIEHKRKELSHEGRLDEKLISSIEKFFD